MVASVGDERTEVIPAVRDTDQDEPRVVRLRKVAWWVLGVTVLLNVLSMAIPALIDHPLTTERGEIRVYFDVFSEGNLPTWWSVALLVLAAVSHAVAGGLAVAARLRGAWAWFVSAVVLGALSLDDHTSLHERLERIGKDWVTFERFPGYWLVPGIIAGVVIAVALGLLAWRLSGMTRWCMILGLGLLLGSAMGMELVQGLLVAQGESGPIYVLVLHAEELGENLGVLLMIAAAVRSVTITSHAGRFGIQYGHQEAIR
ncbi:hypothetical protein [Actinophytocola gossypii]|uniref:Uncharacterized protein n=1 Tax=Actinophytocola gossypii TaxID=2812003 RepID=A0ABT2J988_9PSEU|nr:hypothetical protein [Actinophytocola gossypii]MCT2584276.1 hypothetical protein [Actinophytocola gossypii]